MKIIDLLNKIANEEEVPMKIVYGSKKFEFIRGAYEDEAGKDLCYYDDSCMVFLNDEVEILEDKKKIPEKLGLIAYLDGDISYSWSKSEAILKTRINEIIDYLKSKGE